MTEVSRRFEEFIRSANKKLADDEFLLPIKTDLGIKVGSVLITSNNNLKTVVSTNYVYTDVFLNIAAVKIANLLALKKPLIRIDEIYRADQEYGKWFVDSQHLLQLQKKAQESKDFDRADVLWAKYQESRDKTQIAKNKVDQLSF